MASKSFEIKDIPKSKFNRIETYFQRENGVMAGNPYHKDSFSDNPFIDTILLHWTGSDELNPSIGTLFGRGLGYHFLINKDGSIVQGAPILRRVHHAGKSFGPGGIGCNSYSISISFVSSGSDENEFDKGSEMYVSCLTLIREILNNEGNYNRLDLKFLTGHHWVSPAEKVDPYYFPFKDLQKDLESTKRLMIWETGDGPRDTNFEKPEGIGVFEGAKEDQDGRPYIDGRKGRLYLEHEDLSDKVKSVAEGDGLVKDDINDEDLDEDGEGT